MFGGIKIIVGMAYSVAPDQIAPLQHFDQDLFAHAYITKTCLFKYIENLPPKTENFQIKNSNIFHISAQNIDCGYL